MKSLYNKVFKNYQINVGIPFQVRSPFNPNIIKNPLAFEEAADEEIAENVVQPSPEIEAAEILAQAREQAELIVREAELEAARIIETAFAEATQRVAEIEETAAKNGYQEGYNEGKKQYEDLILEAEFIREDAKAEYNEVLASIEADAVNLILDITRKVICSEVCVNKENMLQLVKQAFDKCSCSEDAVLRVSPEDFDYIVENKERLTAMMEGCGEFEIKKDLSLKNGACIVETTFGNIDAGIETKLKKIEEAFKEAVGRT